MVKDISSFIESQFPSVYRTEGKTFVAFVKAYYEWLEQQSDIDLLDAFDVDRTIDAFIEKFKSTYLNSFPFVKASSVDFLIKHIYDFFRSKGTEESVNLLIMMMFGEESSVYNPSDHILRPSASIWREPRYLELDSNSSNYGLVGKQIYGVKSNAKAIVESVVTKVSRGKYIDIAYISSLQGSFLTGERITHDGNVKDAATIIGSMTSINVINGGRNFKVGDVLDVGSDFGIGGQVRVKSVVNSTGRVDFELIDGGSGYTTTPTTDVYISDGIVFFDNSDQAFIDLETVKQHVEQISLLSAGPIADSLGVGADIRGVNEIGTEIARGIVSKTLTGGTEPLLNIAVTNGTFMNQRRLTMDGATLPTGSIVGDIIETPSRQELTCDNPAGMAVGDRIEQTFTTSFPPKFGTITVPGPWVNGETFKVERDGFLIATGKVVRRSTNINQVTDLLFFNGATIIATGDVMTTTASGRSTTGVVISVAFTSATTTIGKTFGTIESISGSIVTVYPAYGDFKLGFAVNTFNGSSQTGTSSLSQIGIPDNPSRASISAINGNNLDVLTIMGLMPNSGPIWNLRTKAIGQISGNSNIGATDIYVGGVPSANAIIDTVSDVSTSAIIVGQNTNAIGVWGNTSPFLTADDMVQSDTLLSVSQITVPSANRITCIVSGSNQFAISNFVKTNTNLQTNSEIKTVEGVYQVESVAGQAVTLIVPSPDFDNFAGTFTVFPSTIVKTSLVSIKTDRSGMISPPRDANNNIIELNKYGIYSSKGTGATFKIGAIENDEVVFVETDFLKDRNVANVRFMDIRLDGAKSGIGFVDHVSFSNGGNGYSNGQIVEFIGGGMNGGEPEVSAEAVISTNASGTITFINMLSHGEGYWEPPTMNFPASSGTVATNVTVNMDFGYGFPKLPNGDHDTLLIDLLDQQPMNIGTISSLNSINPGQDYDANPFVKVYNRYIAGFERKNFVINMSNKIGSYSSGEMVYQNVGGIVFPKGIVISDTGNTVIMKRTFFNTAFSDGVPLIGTSSGASGTVVSYSEVVDGRVMGDNAVISSDVISANGIIKEIDVIDSGWGYIDGSNVSLGNDQSNFVVEGQISNKTQGKGLGFWETETSHLNSASKIQDSDYYQEFSYEVVSPVPFTRYRRILQDIMHVAGSKMFGRFDKISDYDTSFVSNSSIQVESASDTIRNLYGTADNQVVAHFLPENVEFYPDGSVRTMNNMGGYGSSFDAHAVQGDINIVGGSLNVQTKAMSFDAPIDLVGHRVFFVSSRNAVWREFILMGGDVPTPESNPAITGPVVVMKHIDVGEELLTTTQISIGSANQSVQANNRGLPYPRVIAKSIYEFGVSPVSLKINTAYNGGFVSPSPNTASNFTSFPLKTLFGPENVGMSTNDAKAWAGLVEEIVIIKEGETPDENVLNTIRQHLLTKHGIAG